MSYIYSCSNAAVPFIFSGIRVLPLEINVLLNLLLDSVPILKKSRTSESSKLQNLSKLASVSLLRHIRRVKLQKDYAESRRNSRVRITDDTSFSGAERA